MARATPASGRVFEQHVETIDVTCSLGRSDPDPAWSAVHPCGVTHRWVDTDGGWVVARATHEHVEGFDADGEEYSYSYWACTACHEELSPGMVYRPPDTFRTFMPGLITYSIDGEEVDRATFLAAYAEDHPAPMPDLPGTDRG